VIRYVLAVVLTAALLGASYAAIDQVAVERSEAQIERAIADVEAAAQSLARAEEVPPPGVDGPRRVVTYRFDGRSTRTTVVDVPIRSADSEGGSIDLSGESGRLTIVLELQSRDGSQPVVEAAV